MDDIKLIVTDMDGTFLNSDYKMSPQFPELYKDLKKRGILFVPASGRQMNGITNYFPNIEHEIGFIAENGGYMTYKNEEIFVDRLSSQFIKSILHDVHNIRGAHMVISAKKWAYYDSDDHGFIDFFSQYYLKNKRIEDVSEIIEDNVFKIAVYHPQGSEQHLYPVLKRYKNLGLQVVISGPYWLDIMGRGVNKGKALTLLQNHLGITSDQTMAFGDYMNDVEMLRCAKYSFAMKNAHSEVKKVAKFLASDNNNFGVVEVIKTYLHGGDLEELLQITP